MMFSDFISERLRKQIDFILEADRLKGVLRRSLLLNEDRRENSAEHSWHLALMALTLAEYSPEPINLLKTLRMLVVHDLVEIDAGDTYIYDEIGAATKAEREMRAAERIFGLLPPDLAAELRGAWEEFEARETAEAKFANAVDRLMPLLHNCGTEGRSWREHGVRSGQVLARNAPIREGAPDLWTLAQGLVRQAVADGALAE